MTARQRLTKTHAMLNEIREMWRAEGSIDVAIHGVPTHCLPLPRSDGCTLLKCELYSCGEHTHVTFYIDGVPEHRGHCDTCSSPMISDAAPPSLLSYARAARIPAVSPDTTICPTCAWEARDGDDEVEASRAEPLPYEMDCPCCGGKHGRCTSTVEADVLNFSCEECGRTWVHHREDDAFDEEGLRERPQPATSDGEGEADDMYATCNACGHTWLQEDKSECCPQCASDDIIDAEPQPAAPEGSGE